MKNTRFIIVLLVIFTALRSLSAQTDTKPQFWAGAFTSFGLTDFEPFKLGFGGGIQLAWKKPINYKSEVGLQLGFNRMSNYNRIYGEYSYNVLPSGYQHINKTAKLQALNFLEAGLYYQHTPKVESPWSWSLGVNVSLLATAVGQEYTQLSINLREPDISEEEHLKREIISNSSGTSSLDPVDFASYDISAEAALYYKLTRGLNLRAAFRQGARNLIQPTFSPNNDAQHYLSMLSIGFSARLR